MKILFLLLCLVIEGCTQTTVPSDFKYLGTKPFNEREWKNSGKVDRSLMVYDFLVNHYPYNKYTKRYIEDKLGESTTYYMNDHIPAYLLESAGFKYILVFIPKDGNQVSVIKDVFLEDYLVQ